MVRGGDNEASTTPGDSTRYDAIVIGAGFAGLYMLHLLRDRLGLSTLGLEAADGVGGTWYWNRYPGARCDSESHGYCFTFSGDLVRNWSWSERYPGQSEILAYLNHAADQLDLKRDFQFNTRVSKVAYDDKANLWRIETEAGERFTAHYVITAVGCLSTANVPEIPGLETYQGRWYHTGAWPHDGVDFAGQRVGQIGTGSTGIQTAPVIAAAAKHLTVFQRTANYSVPARNGPLTGEFKTYVRDNYGEIRGMMHESPNGHPFLVLDRSVFDVTDRERQEIYEAAWQRGGLRFRAVFRDLLSDNAANATAAEFIKDKIRGIVKDPDKARILSDIDHPYAAKRPPIDTNYFETFNRSNVSLVDLRADPIEGITPNGIRLRSGAEHTLDVLVFATGFDALTGPLLRLGIYGRKGLALTEAWAEGPKTYLGLQMPGFPNLFTITGPGSPSVLTNMPTAIEQHVEWIADCIASLRRAGETTIEPTAEAAEGWRKEIDRAAAATLLPEASHSWYLGANVPGKPRVFMPYPGGMKHYRKICNDIAQQDYRGFRRGN